MLTFGKPERIPLVPGSGLGAGLLGRRGDGIRPAADRSGGRGGARPSLPHTRRAGTEHLLRCPPEPALHRGSLVARAAPFT